MKNITITLDDDTAARARIHAAARGMSLSRYVGDVLRRELRSGEYESAYRDWRAAGPLPLAGSVEPWPAREEIHDRPVLRRR